MKKVYRGLSIGCAIVFLAIGLFYNTPFQKLGVFFPIILFVLTIVQMFVMKKIANSFIEETNPTNYSEIFNEYVKYPKTIRTALISTGIILILIVLSLTVFSSDVDIYDFEGLQFALLEGGWEVMNYIGLPFLHFGAIVTGGIGMANYEESENR